MSINKLRIHTRTECRLSGRYIIDEWVLYTERIPFDQSKVHEWSDDASGGRHIQDGNWVELGRLHNPNGPAVRKWLIVAETGERQLAEESWYDFGELKYVQGPRQMVNFY